MHKPPLVWHTKAATNEMDHAEMVDLAASQRLEQPVQIRSRIGRAFYVAAGSLLVVIGVLGIFLPLLPSTIFFLLAAGCYGKSSPSAYRWLTTNRYFGGYIRNYKEERGLTLRNKALSVGSLSLGIGAAILFFSPSIWVSGILLVIAVLVSAHLLRMRTLR